MTGTVCFPGVVGNVVLLQKTNQELTKCLSSFLRKGEKVLVCLNSPEAEDVEDTVRACGGEVVGWSDDCRWKTLLRRAFESRTRTVVGTGRMLLALAKLAKVNRIPLNIFRAVVIGVPCRNWILDSLRDSFDCKVYPCFAETGSSLQDNRIFSGLQDSFLTGCPDIDAQRDYLMHWGSILDCCMKPSDSGLSVEIVCFPGERLPKLPSCAKMTLRSWNPEVDRPLQYEP